MLVLFPLEFLQVMESKLYFFLSKAPCGNFVPRVLSLGDRENSGNEIGHERVTAQC